MKTKSKWKAVHREARACNISSRALSISPALCVYFFFLFFYLVKSKRVKNAPQVFSLLAMIDPKIFKSMAKTFLEDKWKPVFASLHAECKLYFVFFSPLLLNHRLYLQTSWSLSLVSASPALF